MTVKAETLTHPLLSALVDVGKRAKLQAICNALAHRDLALRVWFGHPVDGITFGVVQQYLDATESITKSHRLRAKIE